jgi:L,D-transpeptidase-like protein
MVSRRLLQILVPVLVVSLGAAASASAQATVTSAPTVVQSAPVAAPPAGKAPQAATITMQVQGAKNHRFKVGDRMLAVGRISPFVPGQKVEIRVAHKGHVLKQRKFAVTQVGNTNMGRFHLKTKRLIVPGQYLVTAVHRATANQGYARRVSQKFGITYPNLSPGDRSDSVKLFNHLLAQRGYYNPSLGSRYGFQTGLAVLAFRKVNHMARNTNATPGIFRTLAKGQGGFKLKYPNAGKHVEVDISRQVMALAKNGRAQYIFHVSTGAPATPTITGHYQVYQKTPGRLPDGMYYSSFWHGGYAIHGYPSVPTYNASHGCVRIPNSDAIFVYNWLPIGTDVYTYY